MNYYWGRKNTVFSTRTLSRVVSGSSSSCAVFRSVQEAPCQPRVSRLRASASSCASCLGHVWQNPPSTLSSDVFGETRLVEAPVLLECPLKPHWVAPAAGRCPSSFCSFGAPSRFSWTVVDLVSWDSPWGIVSPVWREQQMVLLYIFRFLVVLVWCWLLLLH